MEEAKYSPMVVAAARALCARHSEDWNCDKEAFWKRFGETFLADAQAALDAAGVGEMAAALRETTAWLENMSGTQILLQQKNPDATRIIGNARAALSKTGATE